MTIKVEKVEPIAKETYWVVWIGTICEIFRGDKAEQEAMDYANRIIEHDKSETRTSLLEVEIP